MDRRQDKTPSFNQPKYSFRPQNQARHNKNYKQSYPPYVEYQQISQSSIESKDKHKVSVQQLIHKNDKKQIKSILLDGKSKQMVSNKGSNKDIQSQLYDIGRLIKHQIIKQQRIEDQKIKGLQKNSVYCYPYIYGKIRQANKFNPKRNVYSFES